MSKADKFIEEHTRNCGNELVSVQDKNGKKIISYSPWLTPDQARRACEIEREEVIELIQKYIDKGQKNYEESIPVEKESYISYWDGFSDCARLLLQELKGE